MVSSKLTKGCGSSVMPLPCNPSEMTEASEHLVYFNFTVQCVSSVC